MQEQKGHRAKSILFLILLGLMTLPAIQKKFKIFKEKELSGAIEEPIKPTFKFEYWWSGSYQDSVQYYLKESAGFKPSLIRIHNQMHFWLYDIALANGVIIGKENYLYEENYIKAHLGTDFIGDQAIKKKVNKIKELSDTLNKLDKTLIVWFAPGKGSFYPEYIPDQFNPTQKSTTNYEVYRDELIESGVHFLDFNLWFREMKESSPHPLMPKTGIHWSKYGEIIAADSLLNYLENICNCEYPNLIIDSIPTSYSMYDTDDDIERGMNLYFNISDLEMAYPKFHKELTGNEANKIVTTVADSYFWGVYNWGLSREYFNKGQFWYYNEQVYQDGLEVPLNPKEIDIQKEIEKSDVIILLSTDANLYKFAFGFVDELYDSYYP